MPMQLGSFSPDLSINRSVPLVDGQNRRVAAVPVTSWPHVQQGVNIPSGGKPSSRDPLQGDLDLPDSRTGARGQDSKVSKRKR
jgi:hypothetical protein